MSFLDLIAILIASIAAFALGGLWYSPMLFGEQWKRLSKVDIQQIKPGHTRTIYIVSFIMSFIAAFVFSLCMSPTASFFQYILTGLIIGVFWVATSFSINYLFANKPLALLLIDAGYHVMQFIIYGVVLGIWNIYLPS